MRKQLSVPIRAQSSPLLNLPAEIRNRIWTLAVVKDDTIIRKAYTQHRALPGIIHASRQTRKETLPMYLAQNTFQFDLYLKSKYRDKEFGGKTFGPHEDHLVSMRRLQLNAPDGWRTCHRMVRDDDWSTVRLDYLNGDEVREDLYWANRLRARVRRLLKENMKRNPDGQLRSTDLVSLAHVMSRSRDM